MPVLIAPIDEASEKSDSDGGKVTDLYPEIFPSFKKDSDDDDDENGGSGGAAAGELGRKEWFLQNPKPHHEATIVSEFQDFGYFIDEIFPKYVKTNHLAMSLSL